MRDCKINVYEGGRERERERGGYCIRASADHSWASHIIARIGQWVAPPLLISYTRLMIR